MNAPIWIKEAEVSELMDLSGAITALEAGLRTQAAGQAATMSKTHVSWGDGSTLHAIGAVYENDGIVGTKTWAHTEGGATPLLILWDAHRGGLLAIIEAFALGQMRTASVSAVATRWLAPEAASTFALIGTGKQALAQLAAVAAVRPLRDVRIWGRDEGRREAFVERARALGYSFEIATPATIAEAVDGASVVTTVTRSCAPFLEPAMLAHGIHINAVGAITGERQELAQAVFPRATMIAADDPVAARKLSTELQLFLGDDGEWDRIVPLCTLVAEGRAPSQDRDITIFKSMGMGVSDMALGIEIYRRAAAAGIGRDFDQPVRAKPRLTSFQPIGAE